MEGRIDSHEREKKKGDWNRAVLISVRGTMSFNGVITDAWAIDNPGFFNGFITHARNQALDKEIEAMKNRKQTDKSSTSPTEEKEFTLSSTAMNAGVVNLTDHTNPIAKALWDGMADEYALREMASKMGTVLGPNPVVEYVALQTKDGLKLTGGAPDMAVIGGPLKDELKRFCANWGVPDMPSEELVKCFLACSLSRERWSKVYDSLKGDVHELVAQAKLVGGAMGNIADVYSGRRIAPDVWKALFTGARIKASQTGVISPMFLDFLRHVPTIGTGSSIDQGRQLMLFFARDAVNLREILDDRKVSASLFFVCVCPRFSKKISSGVQRQGVWCALRH